MATWLIWFLAGIGIGVAELIVPGFIIVFFGLGCWGAAVVAAVAPDAYSIQIVTFIAVSVVSLIALRRFAVKMFTGRSEVAAGVGESSIEPGTIIRVDVEVLPARKVRVRYRGTQWDALSDVAIPAGSDAVITGVDDMNRSCLLIKPVSEGPASK